MPVSVMVKVFVPLLLSPWAIYADLGHSLNDLIANRIVDWGLDRCSSLKAVCEDLRLWTQAGEPIYSKAVINFGLNYLEMVQRYSPYPVWRNFELPPLY